jgi:predicted RNA-binding protein with TRAM domain
MLNLKQFFRELVQWVKSPDAPPGALMIVRQRELVTGDSMHVSLTIGIPLLTTHEKAQGVKTRNFLAVKNGDTANPLVVLTGQDASSLTAVVLDSETNPLHYGDKVSLEVRNVDQAGNVSEPLNGEIVLVDTIAPDAPVGSFTMTITEVADQGDGMVDPPPITEPVVAEPV